MKLYKIEISSAVAAIIVFVSVCGLVYAEFLSSPDIFALSFNTFGLISAIITFLNIIIIVLILRTKSRTDDIQWFLLYIIALVFFGACQSLQNFSANPTGALFWEHLGGVGIAAMPAAIFLFVKNYTRSINAIAIWITPLLGICWGVISFFYATGIIIPLSDGNNFAWGYYSILTPEPGYGINLLWFGGMTLLSLVLLIKFYASSVNPILKKQALIFMLAISFPAIVALFTDGILPAFGIGYSIPPLGLLLTTISAFVIFYGITRYRLFRLNPQLLAENVLDTMEEGIIVTSHDLRIETINPQAEKILGQSGNEIKTKSIMDYFPDKSWNKIFDDIKGISAEHEAGGLTINSLDGKSTPVRVSTSILQENNRILGYVFAISDITELQESYDALEKEKENVEHKIEIRTKELKVAQEHLAETDKIKTEFVTLTSHNLRTPLTIIQGNIELLSESNLDINQKKLLNNLQAGTKRLDSLIEELLTISSIETGDHAILEVASLKSILAPIIQEAERLAATSHNSFIIEVTDQSALLKVNVARFQAAIINLLDNAFKFTKSGTIKLITLVDDEIIKIIISDNGIGIGKDEIPKLFTKFHRSNSNDKYSYDYTGEGLGLYFAKLIITEHVGSIDVKSQPGKGSTFTITLPKYSSDS